MRFLNSFLSSLSLAVAVLVLASVSLLSSPLVFAQSPPPPSPPPAPPTLTVDDVTVTEDQEVTLTVTNFDPGNHWVLLKKNDGIIHKYHQQITANSSGTGTLTVVVPHVPEAEDAYQFEASGVLSPNVTVSDGNSLDGMYLLSTDATKMWMESSQYIESTSTTHKFKIWAHSSLADDGAAFALYHDGSEVKSLGAENFGSDLYIDIDLPIGNVLPAAMDEDGYEIRVTVGGTEGETQIIPLTIKRNS